MRIYSISSKIRQEASWWSRKPKQDDPDIGPKIFEALNQGMKTLMDRNNRDITQFKKVVDQLKAQYNGYSSKFAAGTPERANVDMWIQKLDSISVFVDNIEKDYSAELTPFMAHEEKQCKDILAGTATAWTPYALTTMRSASKIVNKIIRESQAKVDLKTDITKLVDQAIANFKSKRNVLGFSVDIHAIGAKYLNYSAKLPPGSMAKTDATKWEQILNIIQEGVSNDASTFLDAFGNVTIMMAEQLRTFLKSESTTAFEPTPPDLSTLGLTQEQLDEIIRRLAKINKAIKISQVTGAVPVSAPGNASGTTTPVSSAPASTETSQPQKVQIPENVQYYINMIRNNPELKAKFIQQVKATPAAKPSETQTANLTSTTDSNSVSQTMEPQEQEAVKTIPEVAVLTNDEFIKQINSLTLQDIDEAINLFNTASVYNRMRKMAALSEQMKAYIKSLKDKKDPSINQIKMLLDERKKTLSSGVQPDLPIQPLPQSAPVVPQTKSPNPPTVTTSPTVAPAQSAQPASSTSAAQPAASATSATSESSASSTPGGGAVDRNPLTTNTVQQYLQKNPLTREQWGEVIRQLGTRKIFNLHKIVVGSPPPPPPVPPVKIPEALQHYINMIRNNPAEKAKLKRIVLSTPPKTTPPPPPP